MAYMKLVTSCSPPDYLTTIMQSPRVENRKVYTSFVPVLSYNQSIAVDSLTSLRCTKALLYWLCSGSLFSQLNNFSHIELFISHTEDLSGNAG